jgi:hypothetical protein
MTKKKRLEEMLLKMFLEMQLLRKRPLQMTMRGMIKKILRKVGHVNGASTSGKYLQDDYLELQLEL